MKLTAWALFAVVSIACAAAGQVPDQFRLYQSDPDPFCWGDSPGTTEIRYDVPATAYIAIVVLSPDGMSVVRDLVQGERVPGLYAVTWDGRDYSGEPVANGSYPYRMTAAESEGAPPFFEDSYEATVDCQAPVDERTWSCIKALYRS